MVLIFQKRSFILITIFFILTAKGHLEIIDTEYSVRLHLSHNRKIGIYASLTLSTRKYRERMPQIEITDKILFRMEIGILIIFIPLVLILGAILHRGLTKIDV